MTMRSYGAPPRGLPSISALAYRCTGTNCRHGPTGPLAHRAPVTGSACKLILQKDAEISGPGIGPRIDVEKSGRAPACEIASVVAMNVMGTVTTVLPGLTPAAIRARRSASVPWPSDCRTAIAETGEVALEALDQGRPRRPAVSRAASKTERSPLELAKKKKTPQK